MITRFQVLYKKQFNREISREEALENGAKLLRLVELIYKPMTKAEYKQLKNIVKKPRIYKTNKINITKI